MLSSVMRKIELGFLTFREFIILLMHKRLVLLLDMVRMKMLHEVCLEPEGC